MNIFMTGGTGNIGQYVTKTLLEAGHTLTVYTRTPERIPQFAAQKNLSLVQGSLRDVECMEKALEGVDAVIHIALGWGNTPIDMLNNDTRITVYLMEKAEKAGVKNFIYTSSTAALGAFYDGINEKSLCVPTDLYGSTKAAAEKYLLGFRKYYTDQGGRGTQVRMRRNIIRPGYIFSNPAYEGGASQTDQRFRDIARSVLKGEDVVWPSSDGTQFLAASQIAQVYLKLVESDLNEEIFLAMSRNFTSWADIARIAISFVPGTQSKVIAPPGDVYQKPAMIDVDKIKRVFGLSFDSSEELREHIRWSIEREKRILAGKPVHDAYHNNGR